MGNIKLSVGIEIGGSNISWAARNQNQGLLQNSIITAPGDFRSNELLTRQMQSLRQEMLQKLGASVDDIVFYGIGSTGQPTPAGEIDGSANCAFKMTFAPEILGTNLKDFKIVNDVAVAAYGAKGYGFGATKFNSQGSPRWDGAMTIGTGTNIQLLKDGELLCNEYGQSFEFGHVPVASRETGAFCGCLRRGCGEAYFAGAGIATNAAVRLTELYMQKYKRAGQKALDKEGIMQEVATRIGNYDSISYS